MYIAHIYHLSNKSKTNHKPLNYRVLQLHKFTQNLWLIRQSLMINQTIVHDQSDNRSFKTFD